MSAVFMNRRPFPDSIDREGIRQLAAPPPTTNWPVDASFVAAAENMRPRISRTESRTRCAYPKGRLARDLANAGPLSPD